MSRPRCRNALSGAASDVRCTGFGVGSTSTTVAISAIAIRTLTPKNGPRQLMSPSSAAEQRTDRDAEAERGLVEDDRAGEAAAGRGHDDRERGRDEQRVAQAPAGPETDDAADACPEVPASAANATMRTSPAISVRLAPIRLDTQSVTSIATAVTTR